MALRHLIRRFPGESSLAVGPRPYVNHSVEMKRPSTPGERARMLESVGLNVFSFPSEMVTGCDLLSDSGTTTMTNEQWASLHLGDEAYGSNRGYFLLMEQIGRVFGEEFAASGADRRQNAFLFHQGRPSEDALFTQLGRLGSGLVIPSNGHFDTTRANIETNRIQALDLFSPSLRDVSSRDCFKGDMDVVRLRQLLGKSADKVPLAYLTVTNNTGGGQPVSMGNIREVSGIAHSHGIPLFLDACRFAENAWFIKQHERGYRRKSVTDIVREMFTYVDGFTISFKKDGLANMGGGLFLRRGGLFVKKYPGLQDALTDHQITREGHPTYGGLSGRDIMAISVGLRTVTREDYLSYRIRQVQEFGEAMLRHGLPVLTPFGGHAVYLDMTRFFSGTALKPADYGGISFTALLLAAYGHRACELGNFAFGSTDRATGRERLPEVNFVRFAVPRLRYEEQDLSSVAEAAHALYEKRRSIPPVEVTYGRELSLRHFKAHFRFRPLRAR